MISFKRVLSLAAVVVLTRTAISEGGRGFKPMFAVQNRLVGGSAIDIEEAPYQLALFQMESFRCGGSLVGPRIGITAAHCIHNVYKELLWVRAGSTFYNWGGQVVNVAEALCHPDYSMRMVNVLETDEMDQELSYINHDIGAIYFDRPLEYTNSIQPIDFIDIYMPLTPGSKSISNGWGRQQYEGEVPAELQRINLTLLSNEMCKNKTRSRFDLILDTMICAEDAERKEMTICQGDSGGPLVYNNRLIGVSSISYNCAPNAPAVFTSILAHLDFIENALNYGPGLFDGDENPQDQPQYGYKWPFLSESSNYSYYPR